MYGLYLLCKMSLKYKQGHTHNGRGGHYGERMNSSHYTTQRHLGRYFWCNFPNLLHYAKGLECSQKNVKDYHNIPIKYQKMVLTTA